MKENIFGIILAGGSGSRLWPLSREMFPKQLLKLYNNSNQTLFQQTVCLLNRIIDHDSIYTVTNNKLESDLRLQYQTMQEGNIEKRLPNLIIEPTSRNTAIAITSSIQYLINQQNINPEESIILILPSDHLILDKDKFIDILTQSIEIAKQNYIVTFGIVPDKPETSYGYIKAGKNLECNEEFFKVESFIEKPDYIKATEYYQTEKYYWNSGIFVFKASVLLEELINHSPEIYNGLKDIEFIRNNIKYEDYKNLPDISIDYAVMEKTDKIVLYPINVGWSDLGSWNTVFEHSHKDANNNFICGNVLAFDCKNSLIYGSEDLITTMGLENKFVVSTEDATLICDKDKTAEIKNIYSLLKRRKDSTYRIHKTQLRPWGYITIIKEEEKYNIRYLCMKPQCKSSLHMHFHKNKHWTVVEGIAHVLKGDNEYYLIAGQSIDIMATQMHKLQNPGKIDVKIIEVQTGDYIIDDDIARFE